MTQHDLNLVDNDKAFSFPPQPIVTALGDWKGLLVMGIIFLVIFGA